MIIRLAKERFWVDAAHIERWPEMLLKLPPEIAADTKHEMAQRYFYERVDDKGRLNQYELFGLFGAERKKDELFIHGCNFLKKAEGGYRLSEDARRLCEAYKGDDGWERLLIEQALKYSLRIRAAAAALLDGGTLVFEKDFLKGMSQAFLRHRERDYFLFYSGSDRANLNDLLTRFKQTALGPFWKKELGLEDEPDFELYGGLKHNPPSLNQIAGNIKAPFALMRHLGWFEEEERAAFRLNRAKIKADVAEAAYESLLVGTAESELDILRDLIQTYANLEGYFPVALVGARLKQRIDPDSELPEAKWIDRYFSSGFHEGRFELLDCDTGQPIDGRGLLGQRSHQLLKIEIL